MIGVQASDLCKSEGHRYKVIDAVKRFFHCKNCKKRVTVLTRLPQVRRGIIVPYTVLYIEYHYVCFLVGIGSSHLLPTSEWSPPLDPKGGGRRNKHSLAGEGGTQFGRLEREPGTLCILCVQVDNIFIFVNFLGEHWFKNQNLLFFCLHCLGIVSYSLWIRFYSEKLFYNIE